MSNLTAKQRRELPLEDFGDPDRRLYPCLDQEDLDSAAHLIGKAKDPDAVKARLIAIARRKGLSLPDAWKTATMAALSLADTSVVSTEGGMVRRTGLLTKAGDFPSHNWAITPDELKAAAEAFTQQGYVELEHLASLGQATILDQHLGYLDAPVWTSDDGEDLYGDLVLPEWLNAIAEQNGGKLSAVFDREEKRLVGVGLVLKPAVPDAALLSASVAFSRRHDTPQGQQAMQHLHDVTAQYGAVCQAGNAGLASKHEAGAIQSMHDMATQHGAVCQAVGKGGNAYMSAASPAADAVSESSKEQATMSETTNQEQAKGPSAADLKALQVQLEEAKKQAAEQQRQLVTLRQERRVEKAEAYSDKLITDGVIVPAQRDALVRLHAMVATDDDETGLVALSDGTQASRLSALVAFLTAMPKVGLVGERIPANPKVTVMLNRQQTEEADEAKKGTVGDPDAVLASTEIGRKALERRRAAAGR